MFAARKKGCCSISSSSPVYMDYREEYLRLKRSRFNSYTNINGSSVCHPSRNGCQTLKARPLLDAELKTGLQVHYRSSCNSYEVRTCLASCG